jgi:hypothetical protein
MKEKIDEEKQRQAALREKILSPHRVQEKKSASKVASEDVRAFQALALSPAGKSRNRVAAGKPKRFNRVAAMMSERPALSLSSDGSSPGGSLQRKNIGTETKRRQETSEVASKSPRRSSHDKKSEEEIAKELILNLFESSISSSQFQYSMTGGEDAESGGTTTPPVLKSPHRRPASTKTPASSSNAHKKSVLTPRSRRRLVSSTTTTSSKPEQFGDLSAPKT